MENAKWEQSQCTQVSVEMVSLQAIAILFGVVFCFQMYPQRDFYWYSFLRGDVFQIAKQLLICSGVILLAGCVPFFSLEMGLLGGFLGKIAPTFAMVLKTDRSVRAFLCVFLITLVFLLSGTLAGNISGQLSQLCLMYLRQWLEQFFYGEVCTTQVVFRFPFRELIRDALRIYVCIMIPWISCTTVLLWMICA